MGFLFQGYLQRRRVQSFCLWKLILNIIVKTAQVHFRKFVVVQLLKSCPTLCNPMDCSTPGLPVLHYLLEFAQTQCPLSQWCHPIISCSVAPLSCLQSFPASPMSQLLESCGESIGASVLPMNIQCPLVTTDNSLQLKVLPLYLLHGEFRVCLVSWIHLLCGWILTLL